MSEIRQGQVCWIDFGPVAGSAPANRHPCVVVQNDVFNRSAIATSVVCLITSNLSRAKAPGNVLLKNGEANLPTASVVRSLPRVSGDRVLRRPTNAPNNLLFVSQV